LLYHFALDSTILAMLDIHCVFSESQTIEMRTQMYSNHLTTAGYVQFLFTA